MKNKKLIFGVVGLLVAVFLILPKVFGGQIESQIRAIPNQKIYQDVAKTYGIIYEIKSYESGWFSSTATFSLTLPPLYEKLLFGEENFKADSPKALVYSIPVKHGPILFGDDGLSFGTALMEGEMNFLGTDLEGMPEVIKSFPPVLYSTLFEFSGIQTSKTLFKEGIWTWEIATGQNMEISWQDTEALSVLNLSEQTLNSQFSMPFLSINMEGQNINMEGQEEGAKNFKMDMTNISGVIDYDLSQTAPLFTYEGFVILEGGEIEAFEGPEKIINIRFSGFREEFNLIRHDDPDIIGYKVPLEMGPVVITRDGETTTPFKSLKIVMEIDNIDQKSILEFYEGYFDMLSHLDIEDPKLAAGELSQEMLHAYLNFLKLGVRFDIPEAFIELEQGTIEYSHKLQFPPLVEEDKENLQVWVLGTIFSGDMLLSAEMVNFLVDTMLEEQLGENYATMDAATLENLRKATIGQLMVAKYMVLEEDGTYSSKFSIEGGILTLNGNQMDLMQALGMAS